MTNTPDDPHPSRRLIYQGRKVNLALQTVTLADGRQVESEVVEHLGAVALLAFVDSRHVCLVKNERYAVGATLIEVPAGTIDRGETPAQTAIRELREETGYVAGHVREIASWWVSPGVLDERMHLFACTDLVPGPTDHQADERIEPLVVSLDEARAMLLDGRIVDAKSMLAILLGEFLAEIVHRSRRDPELGRGI